MIKKHSLKIIIFFIITVIAITPYFNNQIKAFGSDESFTKENFEEKFDKQKETKGDSNKNNSDKENKGKDNNKDKLNNNPTNSKLSSSNSNAIITKKEAPAIQILSPQNGAIIDQNFQVNIKNKEEFESASVYITKTTDNRKIVDLKRVGDYWTGVVDINTLPNDIYYFQIKGFDKKGEEHISKTFWINIDKVLIKKNNNDEREGGENKGNEYRNDKKEETKAKNIKDIEKILEKKEEAKIKKEEINDSANYDEKEIEVIKTTEDQKTSEENDKKEEAVKQKEAKRETTKQRIKQKTEDKKEDSKKEPIEVEDISLKINDLCTDVGLNNKDECINLFKKQNICKDLNRTECKILTDDIISKNFVSEEEIKKAKQDAERVIGRNLHIQNKNSDNKEKEIKVTIKEDLGDKIEQTNNKDVNKFIEKFTPLNIKEQEEVNLIILDTKNKSGELIPAIIALDDDSDGIPNDTEKRVGTNPNNPDTDRDGVSDYEEVINGSNPLGPGNITKRISNRLSEVDLAMLNNRSIEQPKNTGIETEDLSIKEVVNTTNSIDKKGAIFLQGKAFPDSIVTLYIYSQMPIVMTTRTDANGNWTYTLEEDLIDGIHQVYVTVNDDTGKVRYKSSPFSFFIKEAKAVTRADYLDLSTNDKGFVDEFGNYILNSFLVILLIAVLYLFLVRKQNKVLSE